MERQEKTKTEEITKPLQQRVLEDLTIIQKFKDCFELGLIELEKPNTYQVAEGLLPLEYFNTPRRRGLLFKFAIFDLYYFRERDFSLKDIKLRFYNQEVEYSNRVHQEYQFFDGEDYVVNLSKFLNLGKPDKGVSDKLEGFRTRFEKEDEHRAEVDFSAGFMEKINWFNNEVMVDAVYRGLHAARKGDFSQIQILDLEREELQKYYNLENGSFACVLRVQIDDRDWANHQEVAKERTEVYIPLEIHLDFHKSPFTLGLVSENEKNLYNYQKYFSKIDLLKVSLTWLFKTNYHSIGLSIWSELQPHGHQKGL